MLFKLASGRSIHLMGFGTYKITDYESVRSTLDIALATGYRLIDTAHYYQNEAHIGAALPDLLCKYALKREDLWITSKLLPVTDAQSAIDGVEASLKRLQTDYIDLFLIHYPKSSLAADSKDPSNKVARQVTWQVLEKLQEAGKIREIGVANYEMKHLDEMSEFARVKPAINQCECHPHLTRVHLRDYCAKKGIFFQAFTSLGRGAPALMENDEVLSIARKHNANTAQILLAWAICQDVGVIPKSANHERIKSNYEALRIKLSKEETERLNSLDISKSYTSCAGWEVE